jgi:hypothetical protein
MAEFQQPWDSTDSDSGGEFIVFGKVWYRTSQPVEREEEDEEESN